MSPIIHHISSDKTLPKSADVVVIGGGIVGASAAYFLARRGLSVALIEKGISAASSRAGTGAGAVGRTAMHVNCRLPIWRCGCGKS
ncbi:FAD-dependent oxidoreductase [Mesorhizobium sp. WSM2239]|uniref:FAD-dependent oxidoreductase n=1 Tax=Mesorhizobium sp. WSM2239 TaxID=3228852 RepID=A0AAU8DK29_9HYPH